MTLVGEAFVRIRPDAADFAAQLRADVQRTAKEVGQKASDQLELDFKEAGQDAGESFAREFKRDVIESSRQAGDQAADRLRREFKTAGDRAGRDAGQQIKEGITKASRDAADDAERELRKIDPKPTLDDYERTIIKTTKDAAEDAERTFERAFDPDVDVDAKLKRSGASGGRAGGTAAAAGFSSTFQQALGGTAFGNVIGGIGKGAGGKMGAGLIAGFIAAGVGVAIARFLKGSLDAFVDLNEAISKTEVVFEDASDAVLALGDNAAEMAGLSKAAFISAASDFGILLDQLNLGREETAKFSTDLTLLAGDLASFFNISVEDALIKLRAGLVGEAEPLRRLGVLLSEARLEALALSEGIIQQGEDLNDAQKVMLRYQIILQDTGKAQGDFARTADQLANVQRTVGAEFENFRAELGEELAPLMRDFLGLARDLMPVLEVLVQVVRLLVTAIRNAIQPIIDVVNLFTRAREEVEPLVEGVENLAGKLDFLSGIFDKISGINPFESFSIGLDGLPGGIQSAIPGVEDVASLLGKAVPDVIGNEIEKGTNFVKGKIVGLFGGDDVEKEVTELSRAVAGIYVKNAAEAIVDQGIEVKDAITTVYDLTAGRVVDAVAERNTRKFIDNTVRVLELERETLERALSDPYGQAAVKAVDNFEKVLVPGFTRLGGDAGRAGGTAMEAGFAPSFEAIAATIERLRLDAVIATNAANIGTTGSPRSTDVLGIQGFGRRLRDQGEIVGVFEQAVSAAGGRVSSGFRSPEKQQEVNPSAPRSYHTTGQAVDIATSCHTSGGCSETDVAIWSKLYARRSKFVELFGPKGLPHGGLFKNGNRIKDDFLQNQHDDHIHVAFTGSSSELKRLLEEAFGDGENPIDFLVDPGGRDSGAVITKGRTGTTSSKSSRSRKDRTGIGEAIFGDLKQEFSSLVDGFTVEVDDAGDAIVRIGKKAALKVRNQIRGILRGAPDARNEAVEQVRRAQRELRQALREFAGITDVPLKKLQQGIRNLLGLRGQARAGSGVGSQITDALAAEGPVRKARDQGRAVAKAFGEGAAEGVKSARASIQKTIDVSKIKLTQLFDIRAGGAVGAIVRAAQKFGIDPKVLVAASIRESGLNPAANAAGSEDSRGLFQLNIEGELQNFVSFLRRELPGAASQSFHELAKLSYVPELNALFAASRIAQTADRERLARGKVDSRFVVEEFLRPANQPGAISVDQSNLAKAEALVRRYLRTQGQAITQVNETLSTGTQTADQAGRDALSVVQRLRAAADQLQRAFQQLRESIANNIRQFGRDITDALRERLKNDPELTSLRDELAGLEKTANATTVELRRQALNRAIEFARTLADRESAIADLAEFEDSQRTQSLRDRISGREALLDEDFSELTESLEDLALLEERGLITRKQLLRRLAKIVDPLGITRDELGLGGTLNLQDLFDSASQPVPRVKNANRLLKLLEDQAQKEPVTIEQITFEVRGLDPETAMKQAAAAARKTRRKVKRG